MHVAVIGAGIIGAATAAELSERGVHVTVIESGEPCRGTSSATLAWLNSNEKEPETYHRFNVAGIEGHRRFADKIGFDGWLHGRGSLEWCSKHDDEGNDALSRKVERRLELGYPVNWLTRDEALRLEPNIAPDSLPSSGIAHFLLEGWVDTTILVGLLLNKAKAEGANIVTRTSVTGFDMPDDSIRSIATSTGSLEVDAVVNCAGTSADAIASYAGVELPLGKDPGLMVITPPIALAVTHLLHPPNLSIRPDGGGRLLVRNAPSDAEIERQGDVFVVDRRTVDNLMTAAAHVFPGLAGLAAESSRVGVRPIPPGRLPVLGQTGRAKNFFIASCHSGVTLCFRIAELLSQEIVTGETPKEFESFRLDAQGRYGDWSLAHADSGAR